MWIGFIIGLFVGSTIGALTMAFVAGAKSANDHELLPLEPQALPQSDMRD